MSSSATGLTYTNTTGVFSLTAGYEIPTTASIATWDTAYTNRITSLTTTGSSGSATLSSNTLNIPTYTLSGLGGQPLSTNLTSLSGLTYASTSFVKMTASGTFALDTNTYYLASNPSSYIALTALSSSATGLTYTNTTGVFSLTAGYAIPTTASATNWDTAYTNRITSLTVTGSSGASTLVSNVLNIPTYTLTGLGGVPTTRSLTINGTAYDLSADRTWTISTNPSARAEENFVATAAQTTFTITGGYVVGLVDVYVNGVRYLPTDYTATNGTTVVLAVGLLAGDAVTILNYTSSIAALPTSRNVQDFTATAAQTTFTVTNGYIVGLIDVFVNGSKLTASEFTATNGTTFVLTVASTVGDQVQSINYTASVNGISGAGTANYVPKFTASGTIGNSSIFDNGTSVGIGTATPLYNTHIVAPSANAFLGISNQGTANGDRQLRIGFGGNGSNTYASIQGTRYNTADDVNLVIQAGGGNVGIGTSSPSSKLDVLGANNVMNVSGTNATSTYTGYYYNTSTLVGYIGNGSSILSGAASTDFIFRSQSTLIYATGGNFERMRIASNGKVGIGITSPTSTLHVVGGDASSSNRITLAHGSGTGNIALYTEPSGLSGIINANAFFIETAGSERMRINTSGFTKISNDGTYNSSTAVYHEISSTTNNNNVLFVRNTSASPYGPYFHFPNASPNNGTNYFLDCSDSTTIRFQLRSNGGLANYSANDVNLSDIRTKKDIIPLGSYWDKFKAIEIVKFKYKDQSHDDYNIGVISQQVESVAPEFVDIDGFGITPEDGIPLKSIYTADLYHATIKVLQEAMVKIENQQSQIEELKTLLKA